MVVFGCGLGVYFGLLRIGACWVLTLHEFGFGFGVCCKDLNYVWCD